MTTRRGFLGAMLAAATAPAFIKAEILMPVRQIILPPEPALIEAATITVAGNGLRVGDIFTMAGVMGTFVVSAVQSNGIVSIVSSAGLSRVLKPEEKITNWRTEWERLQSSSRQ